MEKEGVGAVIDVLAAKVPQVEAHRAFEMLKINCGDEGLRIEGDQIGLLLVDPGLRGCLKVDVCLERALTRAKGLYDALSIPTPT